MRPSHIFRSTRLSLLSFVLLSVSASGSVLYSDGAINGTIGGNSIYSTFEVTDSFVLSSDATIDDVSNIGIWVATGDVPLTVDWTISTAPDGGGTIEGSGTDVSLTSTFVQTTSPYDIYNASFNITGLPLTAGTYYLELAGATGTNSTAVYWDVNGGPSLADEDGSPIAAESFEIDGTVASAPEPASLVLLGCGLLALGGVRRFRSGR